jgi:hypothetical protein
MVEKVWAALGDEQGGLRPVTGLWSRNYGPTESLDPPAVHVIDATDIDPKPAKGWLYNPETNIFTPPFMVPTLDRVPLVCTSNPALNAVYPLNDRQYAFIAGVASQIANGRGVPGGGEKFNFYDVDNQPHAFSSEEFLNFGQAVSGFVSAALDALHQVPGAQMPSVPITIP